MDSDRTIIKPKKEDMDMAIIDKLKTATSLDELNIMLDDAALGTLREEEDGDYSGLPTWGPKTLMVERLIHQSGPDSDLISWDTTDTEWGEERYLVRRGKVAYIRDGHEIEDDE